MSEPITKEVSKPTCDITISTNDYLTIINNYPNIARRLQREFYTRISTRNGFDYYGISTELKDLINSKLKISQISTK